MDLMKGQEVPDILPEIKQIYISDEKYQLIQNLFQPERSKREDSFCIYCQNYLKFKKDQTFCSCGNANSIRNVQKEMRCSELYGDIET